jgi:hypothetical protein
VKKRYIHVYVGTDDNGGNGYRWKEASGAYDGFVEALKELARIHGEEWVDEHYQDIVASSADGTIAWVTDVLGYCITTSLDHDHSEDGVS